MMGKVAVFCALACGGALLSPQALEAPKGRSFVSFEPMQTVTVQAKKAAPVEFVFRVQPGYHINSNKPNSPELIPTQLRFSLPGDVVIGKVQYPAGKLVSFPFDPTQKLSVYSGSIPIKAVVIGEPDASAGTHTIHGELRYQACDNNSCYPPKQLPITFNVKIAPGTAGNHRRSNAQSPHIH